MFPEFEFETSSNSSVKFQVIISILVVIPFKKPAGLKFTALKLTNQTGSDKT